MVGGGSAGLPRGLRDVVGDGPPSGMLSALSSPTANRAGKPQGSHVIGVSPTRRRGAHPQATGAGWTGALAGIAVGRLGFAASRGCGKLLSLPMVR